MRVRVHVILVVVFTAWFSTEAAAQPGVQPTQGQSTEQMQTISDRFKGRVPLVHNMVEGGNTPTDSTDDLAALGYKIALYPAALLHIFLPAAERVLGTIARDGNTLAERGEMVELKDINALLGADELVAAGKHYGAED